MTGNQKTSGSDNSPRRASNLPLYSLAAVFAAIAGFLAVIVADRIGGPPQAGIANNADAGSAAAANVAEPEASSGLEKLVRSETPKPLPAFTFTDGNGRERRLSDWKGRVVLLNLWATWCAPCKVEMPSLDRLQARLGGPDFQVVPISLDWSGPDKPRQFLKANKLDNLALYLDSSKTVLRAVGALGLPTTVLIDREGREIARLAGAAEWDSPEVVAMIRELMAEPDKI